jgi:hypothetical protein
MAQGTMTTAEMVNLKRTGTKIKCACGKSIWVPAGVSGVTTCWACATPEERARRMELAKAMGK